jgi:hypothetical protein
MKVIPDKGAHTELDIYVFIDLTICSFVILQIFNSENEVIRK